MTRRSLALLACALLICATAQAAPKKKHAAAPAKQTATQEMPRQDIDVDAMARAKDGKPSAPPPKPAEADAKAEPTPTATADDAKADAAPTAATEAAEPAAAAPTEAAPDTAPAAAPESADAAPKAETAAPAAAADGALMERPSPLAPPPSPSDTDKSIAAGCESRATSLLDAAQKGDYAGATRDFDAKMRTALPPPKFKQAWESLAQFGALQGRGQAHPMKGDGYIAITIPLIFDKANLYAQVACGSDGRVAGFYIKPL
jgi:hypothetical protein